MANNFVIRKGLIVSGSDVQPLDIQGTTGQLFNIASSSQGNTFSVNNTSGIPLFKVSGSQITLGLVDYSGSRAVQFSQSFVQVTGSALLESAKVSNLLQILSSFYAQQTSLTQGQGYLAAGYHSHTEGYLTTATSNNSHAEGYITSAQGNGSHAEGLSATAVGDYSHAEATYATAYGTGSHIQGYATTALESHQSVQGQFNISSPEYSAFIVGNGGTFNAKGNLIYAYGTGSNGVVEITGSLRVNGAITGSYSTTTTSTTLTTLTLSDSNAGQEVLFRSNCDVTLPLGLISGFSITITTLNTVAYILTGSGVTLINNKGTTLPMKSSATIVNTGTINEYLVLGDL